MRGHRWTATDPTALVAEVYASTERLFDLGRRTDIIRGEYLLALFGDDEIVRLPEIAERFHARVGKPGWSLGFDGIRAGETLRWARAAHLVESLVVDREPAWRLLDRRVCFMMIGPAARQRSICIHGPGRDPDADHLVKRELRRRERALRKAAEKRQKDATGYLFQIGENAPDMPLPPEFSGYAIAGSTLLLQVRNLLVDDAADDTRGPAIVKQLERCAMAARMLAAERRRAARAIPAEDLEALGEMDFG